MREPRKRTKVTCPDCGGDEYVDGTLWGQYWLRFVPIGKRLFRGSPKVEVSGCQACGHLSLGVEPDAMFQSMGR